MRLNIPSYVIPLIFFKLSEEGMTPLRMCNVSVKVEYDQNLSSGRIIWQRPTDTVFSKENMEHIERVSQSKIENCAVVATKLKDALREVGRYSQGNYRYGFYNEKLEHRISGFEFDYYEEGKGDVSQIAEKALNVFFSFVDPDYSIKDPKA